MDNRKVLSQGHRGEGPSEGSCGVGRSILTGEGRNTEVVIEDIEIILGNDKKKRKFR